MKTVSLVKTSMMVALVLGMGFIGSSCSDDDNGGETVAPLAGK